MSIFSCNECWEPIGRCSHEIRDPITSAWLSLKTQAERDAFLNRINEIIARGYDESQKKNSEINMISGKLLDSMLKKLQDDVVLFLGGQNDDR